MHKKDTSTQSSEISTSNDQIMHIVKALSEITNAIKLISDTSMDKNISSTLQEHALSANRHLHAVIHGHNIDKVVQDAILKFIPDTPQKKQP